MSVAVYVGTYVSAESASQYIDLATINSACTAMIEEASSFTSIAETLQSAADTCDAEAFSIQGLTMQKTIEDCANDFKDYVSKVEAKAKTVRSAAQAAYDKKQQELNEIAKALDKKAIREANNT